MIRSLNLFFSLFLIGIFLLPNFSYAIETLSNTGLVPSNIWFSKDPFYAGDRVRIYSVVFSGSAKDLKGRVNFYDNNTLLCTSEFSALAGRISEVWCDWVVDAGKHNISIKITNPKASSPEEEERSVILSNSELKVGERVVVFAPTKLDTTATKNISIDKQTKTEKTSPLEFVQKIAGIFSGDSGNEKDKIVDDLAEDSRSMEDNVKKINSTLPKKILTPSTFDKTTTKDTVDSSKTKTKSPLSFIASVYPALLSIKDNFYAFTAKIANFVLPKLETVAGSDNKPIAYLMTFFYKIAKFILETPGVFAAVILASIWQVFQLVFRRRDDY